MGSMIDNEYTSRFLELLRYFHISRRRRLRFIDSLVGFQQHIEIGLSLMSLDR